MEPVNDPSELDLRDYLEVLRRRWKLIALAVVVVAAAALLASLSQTSRYRATAEVLVRQPPTVGSLDAVTGTVTIRSLANEVRQAEATVVLDATREVIGSEPTLSVQSDSDADVLIFSAESQSAELAAEAADTYALAFIAARRDSLVAEYLASGAVIQERATELGMEIDSLPAERAEAEAAVPPPVDGASQAAYDAELARIANEYDRRRANLDAQRQRYEELLESLTLSAQLAQGSGAQLIRPAEVPDGPFEPTTARNVALAVVVGLLLGVGAAYLVEYLDTTLRTSDELEAATGGLPTLATVPELTTWKAVDTPHVVSLEDPKSVSAESYRGLRTSVQFLGIDRTISTIAFTSAGPGDGKTTTAVNLAVVAARAGQRVVLLDCDLRKPRVHTFFGLANDVGFTTVLLGESSLEVAAHRPHDEAYLVVIPSGPPPPDPSELLSGKQARSLIASLANQADLVIIDLPPVLAVTDPRILAGIVDGMILVASAGRTDRNQVSDAVELLRLVDAPMLGTVLNRVAAGASTYGYEYGQSGETRDRRSGGREQTRRRSRRSRRTRKTKDVLPKLADDADAVPSPDWGSLPSSFTQPRR
jgi:polysaccharide biosynthesis transport protein